MREAHKGRARRVRPGRDRTAPVVGTGPRQGLRGGRPSRTRYPGSRPANSPPPALWTGQRVHPHLATYQGRQVVSRHGGDYREELTIAGRRGATLKVDCSSYQCSVSYLQINRSNCHTNRTLRGSRAAQAKGNGKDDAGEEEPVVGKNKKGMVAAAARGKKRTRTKKIPVPAKEESSKKTRTD